MPQYTPSSFFIVSLSPFTLPLRVRPLHSRCKSTRCRIQATSAGRGATVEAVDRHSALSAFEIHLTYDSGIDPADLERLRSAATVVSVSDGQTAHASFRLKP